MKINSLITKLYFYALFCFLALALVTSNCKAAVEVPPAPTRSGEMSPEKTQEEKILEIMKEFLDTTKNKEKPFETYATELIRLLQTNPKYNNFVTRCQGLLQIKCKNPMLWGKAFKDHEKDMPQAVLDLVKKKGIGQILAIFKHRLNTKTSSATVPTRSSRTKTKF